jgi:LCP family protein required for cell wall assembly
MKSIDRTFLIILFLIMLAGCGTPFEAGVAAAALLPTGTSSPTPEDVEGNGEATATPFQPIPPTDIITPTNTPTPTETPLPTTTPTPTITPTFTPTLTPTEFTLEGYETIEAPEGQINILLLGADRRPGQKQFRTDTIILVTINSKKGNVNVTSFPRDLYIDIPGRGLDRINTAYFYGKIPLVKQTFKSYFGINIDHYVLVNFKNFKVIVDQMGTLDVKVAKSVSDYRAGKYITVPKGKVKMDADDALWYVRSRKSTNDFERNRRQQEVLTAILRKLLSLETLSKAPAYFQFYKKNVETDLELIDVLKWVPFGVRFMKTPQMNHLYIKPAHVYNSITPGGAMVLVPYKEKVMSVIRKSQNLK